MLFQRQFGETPAGLSAKLSARRRQAVVARFLAVLYVLASLIAAGHHHGTAAPSASDAPTLGASAEHSSTLAHAETHLEANERDCAICDFIAHLVAPGQPVALPVPTVAVVALPLPEKATVAFFPARFCDRSAARAPPVVCA